MQKTRNHAFVKTYLNSYMDMYVLIKLFINHKIYLKCVMETVFMLS